MPVCIEIIRADGRVQRSTLTDERTTVGSSSEASLCVRDAPELEPLHMLFVPREHGVWLSSARNARTPVLLEGKPFESGELALGSEVDVGSITFRVVAPDDGGRARRARNIIMLAVALSIAIPFLRSTDAGVPPRNNSPAPQLFPDQHADCGVEGEAALRRGTHAAERARSKTLRYPFDAREGLSAVELYREAAPCLAGSEAGEKVASEERRLRQHIEDDYQILRLHLERALGESDWKIAAVATRQLLSLLADRPGAYRDWLLSVQRYVELRLSETKKDDKKDGSK
ncbi:MAG TPA: FHA domain-containing protein [Kofleriaceae bacterium]|nr:FHA domain-containing protein [Kofleriaceae bacterium]